MLGITFKEDCPDIRNSRAIDIIDELKSLFEVAYFRLLSDSKSG